jgi:hypothetical protein
MDSKELIPPSYVDCAGIFKRSMWARNRVIIELSYRPAWLFRLDQLIPQNRFLGYIKVLKFGLWRAGGRITLFLSVPNPPDCLKIPEKGCASAFMIRIHLLKRNLDLDMEASCPPKNYI